MRLYRILTLLEKGVSADTETWRITDACLAPKLVLGSVARADVKAICRLQEATEEELPLLAHLDPLPGRLLTKLEICEEVIRVLRSEDEVLLVANGAFDLPVIAHEMLRRGVDIFPDIFRALEEGRVYDIQLAEALHAIAEGHLGDDPRTGRPLVNPETGRRGMYSLSMCVSLNLGRSDAKENDTYRERYDEFDDMPLDQLPEEAQQYPRDDVSNTLECSLAQTGHLPKTTPHHNWQEDGTCSDCGATTFGEQCLAKRQHRNLCNLKEQMYAAFCLQLGAIWGFRVDQRKVDTIEAYAILKRERTIGPFIACGLIREDGSENRSKLKKDIAVAYGSTDPCPVCQGTGKIPAPNPRLLQCKACKGRCVPWKKGGILAEPTVLSCVVCDTSGKVRDPKHLVNCIGPEDSEGEKEKTCDGTGLLLAPTVPLSEKEGIAYGADSLHESGNEFLMSYGDFGEDGKWLKDYIPYLRTARVPVSGHAQECPTLHQVKGAKRKHCNCKGPYRSIPLTLKPDVLKETGRVSYRGYIQLFPRWPGFVDKPTGKYIPSFRECIVPPGAYEDIAEVEDSYELQPGEEWV